MKVIRAWDWCLEDFSTSEFQNKKKSAWNIGFCHHLWAEAVEKFLTYLQNISNTQNYKSSKTVKLANLFCGSMIDEVAQEDALRIKHMIWHHESCQVDFWCNFTCTFSCSSKNIRVLRNCCARKSLCQEKHEVSWWPWKRMTKMDIATVVNPVNIPVEPPKLTI